MVTMRMTEDEREAYLAEPHIGVMSVANDQDRRPHAVPLWYHDEPGGTLTFFTGTMGRTARKTGLIERAGLVSPTVQQETFPYKRECRGDRRPARSAAIGGADARDRQPISSRRAGTGDGPGRARQSFRRAGAVHDPDGSLAERRLLHRRVTCL